MNSFFFLHFKSILKSFFLFFRYFKTLSIWLEETRLQESGLYLPALPPQYMSQKLILVLQGDEVNKFFIFS